MAHASLLGNPPRFARLSLELLPALWESLPVLIIIIIISNINASCLPIRMQLDRLVGRFGRFRWSGDRRVASAWSLSPIMPRLRFKFINSQIISLWLLLVLWTDHVQTINRCRCWSRCRCRSWSFAACESFCQFISCSLPLSGLLPRLSHFYFTTTSSPLLHFFFIFSFCVICFGSLRFARFVFSAFLSTAQLIKKRFRLAFVFVFVPRAIAATHSRILFDSLCSSSHQLKITTMFGLSCPRVMYLFFFGSFRGAFEGFENLTNYLMIDGC